MKTKMSPKKMLKIEKKTAAKIRAPKGFRFSVVKTRRTSITERVGEIAIQLHLSKTNEVVGHVALVHYDDNWYETHSGLDQEYWGKGLGVLMYSKAIVWGLRNGFRVRSSGCGSDMAMRVWNGKSIRKHFKIGRDKYGTHHCKFKYS